MAPPNSRLPANIRAWEQEVRNQGKCINNDPHLYNLNGIRQMDSASHLSYEHWLALRILVEVIPARPTHGELFGSKLGSRLEKESIEFLQTQKWWRYIKSPGGSSLEDWGTAAAWRLSYDFLLAHINTILAQERGTAEIDFSKIYVAPERRRQAFVDSNANTAIDTKDLNRGSDVPSIHGSRDRSQRSNAGTRSLSSSPGHTSEGSADRGSDYYAKSNSPVHSQVSGASAEERALYDRSPHETHVNMSFVLLLQACTMLHPSVRNNYAWTVVQEQFRVTHRNAEGHRHLMTARIDGCLQPQKALSKLSRVMAVVEVKPFRRENVHGDAIRQQEAAEMAAWISTEADYGRLQSIEEGVYRRILISQDLDEIYITVAEFDDRYIRYIGANNPQNMAGRISPESPSRRGESAPVAPDHSPDHATGLAHRPAAGSPSRAPPPGPGNRNIPPPSYVPRNMAPPAHVSGRGSSSSSPPRGVPPAASAHKGMQPASSVHQGAPESKHPEEKRGIRSLFGKSSNTKQKDDGPSAVPPSTPISKVRRSDSDPQPPPVLAQKFLRESTTQRPVEPENNGKGFLKMKQYGKFEISQHDQLAKAVVLIVSITTHLCETDNYSVRLSARSQQP